MHTLYNVRRNDIHSPYMLATPVRVYVIVFTSKRKLRAQYFEQQRAGVRRISYTYPY